MPTIPMITAQTAHAVANIPTAGPEAYGDGIGKGLKRDS
jgi:hypothetical protein